MAHVAQEPSPGLPLGSEHVGEHAPFSLERLVSTVERNWRWVLAGMMLLDVALLLYLGRGLTFFYDDWDYVTHDYGGGIHSLLQAHNGHMSVFPVAVYKTLFHLVGLNHYAVFRLVLIALHLACAGLVFVLASRRVPRFGALLASALILFLGVAWEDLLWAFQMDFMLSILGGLSAWLLLERRDRPGDLAAMLAVIVAVGSSGLGIPVLIGVAVELASRREWRRGFVVVAPAVLYALWYLQYGENEITNNGLINSPGFAEDIAAAAFGGLAGRGVDWGRPIALLGGLLLVRHLARSASISARLAGLLATGISLWVLTAAARSTISSPETSRYVYFGAVVIVLAGVELLRDVRPSHRLIALSCLLVALCAVAGLTALRNGALGLRGTSHTVAAELGALELAAAHAPPTFQPDTQRAPQISAGPYLHTVRAIGSSPGDTPAAIAAADSVSRAAADAVLLALEPPTLRALAGRASSSSSAPAPAILALTGGASRQRGGCVELTPLPGGGITAVLAAPPGGAFVIGDLGTAPASTMAKRFGDTFIPLAGAVAPKGRAALSLPLDGASRPWQLQVSSPSALSVCR